MNSGKIAFNSNVVLPTETYPVESDTNVPIEHQNVPVAHQGLHGFLYGSDNEHGSSSLTVVLNQDGADVMSVDEWRSLTAQVKIAGVYAVLDSDRQTQYIGYSRDVRQSLESHLAQHGADVCAFIQVQTFKFPKRQVMEALRDEWIAALNYVPVGNQSAGGAWASTISEAAQTTMSATERNAYEEKKLKLRKAMADSSLLNELEKNDIPDSPDAERRRNLEAAVKNDDWSDVIGT